MCVEHIRPSCGPALDSSDIQLMAMHGSMLQDASRVSRVLQLPLPEFGLGKAAAEAEAADIAKMASKGFFDGRQQPPGHVERLRVHRRG